MDIKLLSDIPSDGISLFQTRLCHTTQSKAGRTSVSETDGECRISGSGGVGLFGSYGNVTKKKMISWMRFGFHLVKKGLKLDKAEGESRPKSGTCNS